VSDLSWIFHLLGDLAEIRIERQTVGLGHDLQRSNARTGALLDSADLSFGDTRDFGLIEPMPFPNRGDGGSESGVAGGPVQIDLLAPLGIGGVSDGV
jgi:hypothetical protein